MKMSSRTWLTVTLDSRNESPTHPVFLGEMPPKKSLLYRELMYSLLNWNGREEQSSPN